MKLWWSTLSSSNEELENSTRKQNSEEPLDPKLFDDYGLNEEFIHTRDTKAKDKTSASTSQSLDNTQTPKPATSWRDDNNKYPVVQNGVNLDLSHVPFKDQEGVIDD